MEDELKEINGIKPNFWLDDGEEREMGSQTSNSVYKVKRTFDHYYCTCPAWRNQGGVPVNARTCKHLKSLLGDKYENARVLMKNPDGPPPKGAKPAKATKAKPSSKAKPASKAAAKKKKAEMEEDEDEDEAPVKPKSRGKKATSAKRKRAADDDDDDEDEEDDEGETKPPPSKRGRKAADPKPRSRGKKKSQDDDEDEEEGDEDEDDDDDAPPVGKSVPELLLANKWDIETGPDPKGWWVSEKLDGVRTYYDGSRFISRLGNPFTPPQWFLDKLPTDLTLDGELYGGRGEFQSTVSVVKTVNSPHWKTITFQIFDIPSRGDEPFEDRYNFLRKTFGEGGTHAVDQISVVPQELAKDRQHVLEKLKEVEAVGGEGLMLRKAASTYEGRRSMTLLKIKSFFDAEAIVTGYVAGKGRLKGSTGALKCKMASGKTFNVGSGLSDKQRKAPPKIGTIIVYRFQELTRDRVPRFPTFVGVAADKTEPKDADVPVISKASTSADV